MTYYEKNKDRIKANTRRWQAQNKERARELGAAWRKAHPDYGREYRLAHPELKLRKRGVRKPLTPEQRLAKTRRDNERRKERYWSPEAVAERLARRAARKAASKERQRVRRKVYQAAYNKAHPEARQRHHSNREAQKRGSGGKLSRGIYKRLLTLQRGLCVVCHTKPEKFHLDHIIPLAGGGTHSDENVQLLCPDCNIAKSAKHPVDFMQSRGFLC